MEDMMRIAGRYKLGKKPFKPSNMVKMSTVADTLPPPRTLNDKYKEVKSWILGDNDKIGDCVIVAGANCILLVSTLSGKVIMIPTKDIVAYYSKLTGYNPANPLSDEGTVETDFLTDWRVNGYPNTINGADKLIGSMFIEPTNHYNIKQAIDNFGVVLTGVNFPQGWEDNIDNPIWSMPSDTKSRQVLGGHGMAVVGYDENGFQVVSWAMVKTVTYDAWDAYCDECYALLIPDFIKDNVGANGEAYDYLVKAMLEI